MEATNGIFIVISGLSGTGKNFFQDTILESSNEYERIPKYTTRSKRGEEDSSIDFFEVDQSSIEKCRWHYGMNGHSYGIKDEDVKKILRKRKECYCHCIRFVCFISY